MTIPIEINTNLLPIGNLFKTLFHRERYNTDGIIKYGFLGVFCIKSGFYKEHLGEDINELMSFVKYDRVFIINSKTDINIYAIEPRTLLIIDCSIFKDEKKKLNIPMDFISICCNPCNRGLSIVLIIDKYIPKIWQNADFVYREANLEAKHCYDREKILELGDSSSLNE